MQQIFQPSAPGDAALKTELDAAADTLAAGNLRDAREAMDSLLTKAPGDYKVLQLAGTLALSENRGKQAADYFRGALSVSRLSLETSRSLHGLGLAFAQMGDFAQASEAFARAVQAHPGNLVSLLKWAEALGALNRNSEAETMLRNALPRFSDDPRISIVLGNILTAQNRQADALHIYDGVIEKYPDSGMAHFNRSIALTMLGRIHEAEQDVMRALELDPAILGYYHLSAIHAFSKEDPWFAKLTERSKMTLDEDARIDIDFALAKAYEDIAEYDRAFKHLEAGNTRKRRMLQFNMGNEEIRANRITSLFTPDFFARFHGKVGCDLRPIFILGMPRSGSTLLEQMLAAHPAITAGGELPYMIDIARDIGATWGSREINFPGSDTEVIGDLQAGADRYASLSASLRESKVHFTDKLPGNFQFIGLIHLMFPDAVIINIKRDPVDTCLSCYQRLFTSNVPYSYDLTELGQYYRFYERLMKHWNSVLPGMILDVEYEKLIVKPEQELRRIFSHCGLEFDPASLKFDTIKRTVTTASAVQVKKPLYQSSMLRWKHYEFHLAPLLRALKEQPQE